MKARAVAGRREGGEEKRGCFVSPDLSYVQGGFTQTKANSLPGSPGGSSKKKKKKQVLGGREKEKRKSAKAVDPKTLDGVRCSIFLNIRCR